MSLSKLDKIPYGGDYNPDQWPEEIWDEDMRLFRIAGIDMATVGVFSWAKLQPSELVYNFEWLDEVLNKLQENGVRVCLATGTAAHPAWMAKRYPDVLRVDFEGRKHRFGQRHNFCPNSPTYREYSRQLAGKIAQRYKDHPALALWHVNNEYGGICYCDNCAQAFRNWLKHRYGSLENVNSAWDTAFWGHLFYDWNEIVPPNLLSEHLDPHDPTRTAFQGISLDYARFNSDSLLDCYRSEYEEIKKHTPHIPVTTNLMGTYKPLDYFRWAPYLDVISWDNYPSYDTPVSQTALRHDLMRGLKQGQSFMLMEQTPSQQNWQPYNSLKRPGVMRLWSYQAISRGADSVLFFQLRRSAGACEKFHGAVIEHAGHEHTRVFRECAQLGAELQELGDVILDSRVDAKVAIVFDWDNWWAIEYSSGPSVDLKYLDEVQKYYDAFYSQNIQVDMVGLDSNLDGYDIVIAPVLYMVKPGYAKRLESFVENGGLFLTTFFSGIVNEMDLVTLGGYPGELRKLLGIWVEEIDALLPDMKNRIVMKGNQFLSRNEYSCSLLCDLIHSEGAEVVAEYGDDFYEGMPVLTRNHFGNGEAWYVASSPSQEFLQDLATYLSRSKGIQPVISAPNGVEVSQRNKDGVSYTFVLNHTDQSQSVDIGSKVRLELLTGSSVANVVEIGPKGVMILQH
ncbi:beta-galactosidase [Alicyclobacillus fastidiosus]|uniref:Beta-galactosidase n=1 Tax=Alicyclobacillus fastidiosus TaxID=392011 RepID=A0ABY6ZMZ2_9BACL|nr:beta-galactosidase [Alicyclobacillus fastidiosus]WAH43938.1 beta-galactosidase [Alicyclobacillus fastidiosus]GMA60193.1 beta-galactosidase [Alicyclobacillus fastidiosus]